MNTRCLVSRRPSCPTLFHQNVLAGPESRLASRMTIIIPASNRRLSSVRTIQWCTGWPWRGRRRVAREEDRLDDMRKNFQDLYTNISHTHRLNISNLHHHHNNRWRRWSKRDHLSENRGRWRAGRDRDEWENKPPSGQRDEFEDIIKRIEADPYEFLFGRSNAYLRLPKAWSPFCRSFLDFGSTRDAKPKTGADNVSNRKVTDDIIHPDKVPNDSGVTSSATSAAHNQDLQFDPISGRMVPHSQPVEKQKEKQVIDIPAESFSVSTETASPGKDDLQSGKVEDAPVQSMSKEDIIHLEDTSNSAYTPVDNKKTVTDSVSTTQKPEVVQETNSPTTDPKLRQFSDFDDENIDQLSASDIRASFASKNEEISNDSVESTRNTSTEQVNEAAKHVKGFSGSMQLLNQELIDLCERLEASSAAVEPDLYRVLAYDPSTSEVVIAETTSSVHATGKALPPSEVMLSINNPAKFLPYFARMKADGYEIVSGGGNILVFKKGPTDGNLGYDFIQSAPSRISNMPVGSQTGMANIANANENSQPVNQINTTEPISQKSSKTSPRMVRRQETIYTGGPPDWSPYPPPTPSYNLDEEIASAATSSSESSSSSSFGKSIRRVFLTGFATAGVFYAVGVVCEYFRTGGQDGLGPVGFTAFEAERRRRE